MLTPPSFPCSDNLSRLLSGFTSSPPLSFPSLQTEETTLLKHLGTASSGPPSRGGTVTPPSPSYQSMAGGNSFGDGGGGSGSPLLSTSPPAAPGIEERASLLVGSTRSGSQRWDPSFSALFLLLVWLVFHFLKDTSCEELCWVWHAYAAVFFSAR